MQGCGWWSEQQPDRASAETTRALGKTALRVPRSRFCGLPTRGIRDLPIGRSVQGPDLGLKGVVVVEFASRRAATTIDATPSLPDWSSRLFKLTFKLVVLVG